MQTEHFLDHRPEFRAIAEVCLRAGATCVYLLEGAKVIDVYPVETGAALSQPGITASSSSGLTLQVCGISGEPWQSAAETMVELFARLLNNESELENLTAALVETQDRLVALYDLSQATRHTLDIPALLKLLARETCRILAVNGAFAILTQPGQISIIRQHGARPLSDGQIHAAATLYQRKPTRHTFKDSQTLPVGLRNVMMVSIPVRDGISASLGVYNKTGDFASPDIKLAKALAEQTGAQLENALLVQEALARTRMETEMNLARQVQMALLPQQLPQLNGFDLYASSHPALEVGGDFFDLVTRPNHPFTFLLGDVTGKGMPAALLMTMTRTVAHAAARNMPFTEPHQLMKRLNVDLLDDFSTVGMFTTAFIGVLDPSTRRLLYCNAGQSPILYIPAMGQAALLEAQDIPIGIFDDYNYTSCSLMLAPGDILIVASDGFPEARNIEGEMFGYERMKAVFMAAPQFSAHEMSETLFATVQAFSNGHLQDDDQTLIVLKVL